MAKQRSSFEKRQRERAKRERRERKAQRKEQRKAAAENDVAETIIDEETGEVVEGAVTSGEPDEPGEGDYDTVVEGCSGQDEPEANAEETQPQP